MKLFPIFSKEQNFRTAEQLTTGAAKHFWRTIFEGIKANTYKVIATMAICGRQFEALAKTVRLFVHASHHSQLKCSQKSSIDIFAYL